MEHSHERKLTEKEKEFANTLIKIGTERNVAIVLAFFTTISEATSLTIEQVTDLSQPKVSIVLNQLKRKGWIRSKTVSPNRGRPSKMYELAKPLDIILEIIEKDSKMRIYKKIATIQRIRDRLSEERKSHDHKISGFVENLSSPK